MVRSKLVKLMIDCVTFQMFILQISKSIRALQERDFQPQSRNLTSSFQLLEHNVSSVPGHLPDTLDMPTWCAIPRLNPGSLSSYPVVPWHLEG